MEDVPFYKTTDLSIGKQVGITKPGFVLTRNYADKVPGARGEAAFLARPVRALCPSPLSSRICRGSAYLPFR